MDLGDLLIFVVQQMGVVLGTGAEMVVLFAYLAALRGHEPDFAHQTFVRVARHVQSTGITLMIVSGVAAVVAHMVEGSLGVIAQPTFLAKWILIVLLAACFVEEGRESHRDLPWFRGFVGANWLALFLLHTVAPVSTWSALGLVYIVLIMFSMVGWYGFVLVLRHAKRLIRAADASLGPAVPPPPRPVAAPAPVPPPAPKPIPPPKPVPPPPPPKPVPPPPPKPVPPPPPKPVPKPVPAQLPEVHHEALPAAHMAVFATAPAVQKPVPTPPPAPVVAPAPPPPPTPPDPAPMENTPDYPALRVMPRTPEDIPNQFRASAVELKEGEK